jgi:hypothetical protein
MWPICQWQLSPSVDSSNADQLNHDALGATIVYFEHETRAFAVVDTSRPTRWWLSVCHWPGSNFEVARAVRVRPATASYRRLAKTRVWTRSTFGVESLTLHRLCG